MKNVTELNLDRPVVPNTSTNIYVEEPHSSMIDIKEQNKTESGNDVKTRFQAVKEAFHEWSSRTDMNNYGKIFEYRGNIWAQMIWILIFLVLTALTIVLIQMSIGAYLDYGVTSAYSVVSESPSQLPAITICAASPFSSRADDLFNQIALNNSMNLHHSVISVLKLAKMKAAYPST